MVIDCDACTMQDTAACDDCVVTVLLAESPVPGPLQLDLGEAEALQHLAEAGLVAPLRLVPRPDRGEAVAG